MSTDQLNILNRKSYHVDEAKRRVANADKALQTAVKEKDAAESELRLRTKEYRDACDSAIGLVDDIRTGGIRFVPYV